MHLRLHPLARIVLRVAVVGTAIGGLAACGSDDGGADLPAAAADGRDVARSNGCAACHGRNGEGGPGPAFSGLFGSTVELEDGSSVVADADYLFESIRDPGAKVADGFGITMPTNDLSDAEIESVIAWIEALAEPEASP